MTGEQSGLCRQARESPATGSNAHRPASQVGSTSFLGKMDCAQSPLETRALGLLTRAECSPLQLSSIKVHSWAASHGPAASGSRPGSSQRQLFATRCTCATARANAELREASSVDAACSPSSVATVSFTKQGCMLQRVLSEGEQRLSPQSATPAAISCATNVFTSATDTEPLRSTELPSLNVTTPWWESASRRTAGVERQGKNSRTTALGGSAGGAASGDGVLGSPTSSGGGSVGAPWAAVFAVVWGGTSGSGLR